MTEFNQSMKKKITEKVKAVPTKELEKSIILGILLLLFVTALYYAT